MLKSALLCGGSVVAAAIGLYGASAWADTAAPASAAEATPAVGELVVVAEKREQKIESVPVAITAFSSQQRALEGIVIFNDLADMTPGLTWTDTDDRIYIRGIGRNSDNLNNTSGVALYYNGIYYGANAAIELQRDDLFIASTEVDKGPQNTLHGSNADGGVVDFESQHPTDTYYAEGRVEVDNYSTYRTEFALSGPIDDHLKFRLGGNYTQQTGGFFNNLDGPPQGGDLVLGGGGQTHYLEAQLQGNWNHFDLWTLVSSGDFAANNRQGSVVGYIPDDFNLSVFNPWILNSFYGLCGLPGVAATANGAGCSSPLGTGAAAPSIVPGSVKTDPFTANMFPGNNPGNINPRDFLQEWNSINDQQRNVQISVHATYHAPDFDITYYGGYQQFHYILEFVDNLSDAGITSFQLTGATPAAAGLCESEGFTAGACEAPLTVNPQPQYTLFDEYDQSFSHEINITSTWSSPFQYVAGFYWYHEHWNQPVDASVEPGQAQFEHPYYLAALSAPSMCSDNTALAGTGLTLCPAPINPCDAFSCENTDITYDSLAGYAQGTYKFSDQWKATGAVRYTSDFKRGWQEWRFMEFLGPDGIAPLDGLFEAYLPGSFGSATPAIDLTPIAAPIGASYPGAGTTILNTSTGFAERTLSQRTGAVTGEADIDWTPDPTSLAYLKYSRGYKSGGWSTYTLAADPTVNPEYVDAFELGGKKTIGRSLTVNSDIFYYNYSGMQVPLTVETVSGLTPILYNVPVVHTYGLELEAFWRPIDPLTFSLGYSYLSSKIAQSACIEDTTDPLAIYPGANTAGCYPNAAALAAARAGGAVAQNVVGEEVPQATPNHVSLNALYTIPFDPGKLTLSATFIWKDNTYDAVFNRYYNLEPSYSQVNLRATWTDAKDRFTVVAFVNNLFNDLAADGTGSTLLTNEVLGSTPDVQYTYNYTAPRTFGLQFLYRWR